MKNIYSLLIISALVISCGGDKNKSIDDFIAEGDLKALRAKKNEIATSQKALAADISKLDSIIAVLDDNKKLPLVSTITVVTEKFDHYLDLQGDVKTKQNVLIYPEMPGTLTRVYVKTGQKVRKGQLLATIDNGGIESQLAQLKTQSALAKTTFERQKRLWNQKIGSEIQFLQAKATYEASESSIKHLSSQLGKFTLNAPFSGIIDDVIKDQGTVVAPGSGSEIFRIVNLSNMYIKVDVPEAYLGQITKGKEAKVFFPVFGETINTKVRETGNFIKEGNRSFSAEIAVPNKSGLIKPNLMAKVRLNDYTNENAILIPQSIISENAKGEQYVYIAQEPNANNEVTVKKTIISTGKTQNGKVEVLAGVENGNLVIKEGARSVKDGQKVQIQK
ncbi:MAG: efflux RND transporter periplasmic adaptor subunit [Cellulophaga sp.]